MREDIKNFLEDKGVIVTLKGYKEMPSSDGYHMRGNLYVNGKKAIFCENLGTGGEMDICVLNKDNAKPLLDLLPELAEFKAFPGDKYIGDIPFRVSDLFIILAEELLIIKRAKRRVLVRLPDVGYENKEVYSEFNCQISKEFLKYLIKRIEKSDKKVVEIFNFENKWIEYTIEDLENKLNNMN